MTLANSTCFLFVPGTRSERFVKAEVSNTDCIIIDWEDAVSEEEKPLARSLTADFLLNKPSKPVYIRINSFLSPFFSEDVAVVNNILEKNSMNLAGIVLPKASNAGEISSLKDNLPFSDLEIVALIETALGVQNLAEICNAGADRLALGALDLSHELGASLDSPLLDTVIGQMVIASRAANINQVLGSPPIGISDITGIAKGAQKLKKFGVGGQLCIHPNQIAPIKQGFAPTAEEIEWAKRITSSTETVFQIDGIMVDKPVKDRALKILAWEASK